MLGGDRGPADLAGEKQGGQGAGSLHSLLLPGLVLGWMSLGIPLLHAVKAISFAVPEHRSGSYFLPGRPVLSAA